MAKVSKPSGKARAIKLGGDLRISGAAAVLEALRSAAGRPESHAILDASGVEKVDAAGLQALYVGRQLLAQAGKTVSWKGKPGQLAAAAELLGLSEALELSK
jgi:anti-anti-sigma regulatory factor